MTIHSSLRTVPDGRQIPFQKSEENQRTIHHLIEMAVKGLVPMLDPESHLFCFTLKKTSEGMVREGISHRYTMFTLMGLQRLEESGRTSPFEIGRIFDSLVAQTDWVDNIGDLGLLLWVCALVAPHRLEEIARRLEVKTALTRFRDARQCRTMEMAWFLSGLSHGTIARPGFLAESKDLAIETYRQLILNQGEQGIFGHLSRHKSITGLFRGSIGSFADQVYPIYGITKFAQAFHDGKATERALDCALAICEAQGSQGQWWWHYDSLSGRVVDGFPVFSVHQHGMAPMTLFALGEAIQSDFTPWINKGLQWIADNELGIDMKDSSASVVWRCIFRPPSRKYWNAAIGTLTKHRHRDSRDDLQVLYECRPYELGFLLYAFADKVER